MSAMVKLVKVKDALCTMPWRHMGVAQHIMNLGTRWRWWSASHSGHFNPREKAWYPLERRLGGPQSWCEHGDYEKNPCLCQKSL